MGRERVGERVAAVPVEKPENSSRLNVITVGDGQIPLVMLHGWGQSLDSLRPLAELLAAKGRRCILIDLPGFGGSSAPVGVWGSAEYAEVIEQYLAQTLPGEFDILGHSVGGKIAMKIAARNGSRVRRVVLIASAGVRKKRTLLQQIRLQLIKRAGKAIRFFDRVTGQHLFDQYFAPRYGSRDYRAAGALRPTLVRLVNEDLQDTAASIVQPTLLIWGSDDDETPVSSGEQFSKLIADSKLMVLPGKDHFPFAGAGAHPVAQYINSFCSEETTKGHA